jgi:hypothetical protein
MGIVHKKVKYYSKVKLKPQDGNKGTSPNHEFQQNLKKMNNKYLIIINRTILRIYRHSLFTVF